MNERRTGYYKMLFLVASVCDIALGLVFIFFYKYLFRWLGVPLPYSTCYVTLSGAFPLVIGVAYYLIARRPAKPRSSNETVAISRQHSKDETICIARSPLQWEFLWSVGEGRSPQQCQNTRSYAKER